MPRRVILIVFLLMNCLPYFVISFIQILPQSQRQVLHMNVLSMASMDESIASSHDLQRYAQRRRQHPTFIDRGAVVHSCSKLVFQNDSAASVAIVLWSLGTMKFSLSNEVSKAT